MSIEPVKVAYLSLLAGVPAASPLRLRLQSVLATLRDEIAAEAGCCAQDVQDEYERAAPLTSAQVNVANDQAPADVINGDLLRVAKSGREIIKRSKGAMSNIAGAIADLMPDAPGATSLRASTEVLMRVLDHQITDMDGVIAKAEAA